MKPIERPPLSECKGKRMAGIFLQLNTDKREIGAMGAELTTENHSVLFDPDLNFTHHVTELIQPRF